MTSAPHAAEVTGAGHPGRRAGRRRRRVAGVAAVVLLVAGLAAAWVERRIDPPGPPGPAVEVVVPRGASTARIAAILDREGVVTSAWVFRLYVRLTGAGPWQAGTYRMARNLDMGAAVRTLDRGPLGADVRLTVPEGFTLEQVAERVGRLPGRSATRFREVAASGVVRSAYQPPGGTNLEGLVFPDTYLVGPRDTEERILRRMVAAFDDVAAELDLAGGAARLGLSPYEVVIVASMIEREARIPAERPMVARVIYNRLARGMRLGIDATIRYELGKPTGPLLRSELERDSPYNTRTRAGLPPTPIANPGRAALEAALHPADGPWLYYVIADAAGHHTFATTDAEFQRAKAAARAKGLL